jgi:hypothetical protein
MSISANGSTSCGNGFNGLKIALVSKMVVNCILLTKNEENFDIIFFRLCLAVCFLVPYKQVHYGNVRVRQKFYSEGS